MKDSKPFLGVTQIACKPGLQADINLGATSKIFMATSIHPLYKRANRSHQFLAF